MNKGTIIKALSGFYYVEWNGKIISTKGRGSLKNKRTNLYVGDEVEFHLIDDSEGVINRVLPRKNFFIRPPVSNVDKMIIVVSATVPQANPLTIDKFIAMAMKANCEPVLCINKVDKGSEEGFLRLKEIYEPICKVIGVSALKKRGLGSLKEEIKDFKIAFSGPSGVGKSTIISALTNRSDLEIGNLSNKTKRGRHTTRHVEIFTLECGGKIFDTPGFSSFDILGIDKYELGKYYKEIDEFSKLCKYNDCLHINEPECAVKEAVETLHINKERYLSYVQNLKDIEENRRY